MSPLLKCLIASSNLACAGDFGVGEAAPVAEIAGWAIADDDPRVAVAVASATARNKNDRAIKQYLYG